MGKPKVVMVGDMVGFEIELGHSSVEGRAFRIGQVTALNKEEATVEVCEDGCEISYKRPVAALDDLALYLVKSGSGFPLVLTTAGSEADSFVKILNRDVRNDKQLSVTEYKDRLDKDILLVIPIVTERARIALDWLRDQLKNP